MKENDTVEIYGLYDNLGNLRYIGKANNSLKRFKGHMSETRRKTPLYNWIAKLKRNGEQPILKIMQIVPLDQWEIAEKTQIFEARLRGEKLLNIADGGDQPKCPVEVRRANGAKTAKLWSEFPYWRMAINQLTAAIAFYEKQGKEQKAETCLMAIAKLKHLTKEKKIEFNETIKRRFDDRKIHA